MNDSVWLVVFCGEVKCAVSVNDDVAKDIKAQLQKKSSRYHLEKVRCSDRIIEISNELDVDMW